MGSRGKYVPHQNGFSPPGSRNTLMGHPPEPVISCVAVM
jgi:hypothetical protein